MHRLAAALLCACLFVSATIAAAGAPEGADASQARRFIGYGRLITNDLIGDTQDRWRTGSVASSRIWGPEWQGELPQTFGRVLEFRFDGQVISPENLRNPAKGDRPYVGELSFGLHTHFRRGGTDMAVGADLSFVGPQTGLDRFQNALHKTLGGNGLSGKTRSRQLANDVTPTLVLEASHPITLAHGYGRVRPFASARWGQETLVRAGADLFIGGVAAHGLMVRDPVTGQSYNVVKDDPAGLSFVVGGDVAWVEDSKYLPNTPVTHTRKRLRAGVHWENAKGTRLFYGVTWLGKEFAAQREGQVIGSIRLDLHF